MPCFLVSASSAAMVGIEQCRIVRVGRARQAAFLRAFAGRVLGPCVPAEWPGVPVVAFKARRRPRPYQPLVVSMPFVGRLV